MKGMTQHDTLRYSNWELAWNPGEFSHILGYLPNTEKYLGSSAKVSRLNSCQASRSCNKKTTHRDTHTAIKPGNQGVKKLFWEQKVKTHLKVRRGSKFQPVLACSGFLLCLGLDPDPGLWIGPSKSTWTWNQPRTRPSDFTWTQTQALEPDLVSLHGSEPGKETRVNHVLGSFYRAEFLRLFKG
jgi:hypothetical protein